LSILFLLFSLFALKFYGCTLFFGGKIFPKHFVNKKAICLSSFPGNTGSLMINSSQIKPSAQISIASLATMASLEGPKINSGALYHKVPAFLLQGVLIYRASSKSHIFTLFYACSLSIKMFAGFKSL